MSFSPLQCVSLVRSYHIFSYQRQIHCYKQSSKMFAIVFSPFLSTKSRTLWKSHQNFVLSWLTDNMLEFIGNRHLLPFFGIFRIKSRICQSGATIVVQILSSASASKAPTAYFPLIKTLNNNYNLCTVSLSAVRKYWSHWEQKESFHCYKQSSKMFAIVFSPFISTKSRTLHGKVIKILSSADWQIIC